MKHAILKLILMLPVPGIMISCHSTTHSTTKKENMFTTQQIEEKFSKVRTGADFPALAMELKNLGVTYYETSLEDGRSIYHGANGYELAGGPNYAPIKIAGTVNAEQLKADIAHHQKGGSDYFQISRQCADNGIAKWAVCLVAMTCTYIDKAGNKILVEHIPPFTVEQVKAAHSKVRSGADFPAYIRDIKKLGVTRYKTFVSDGHTDYYGANGYQTTSPAKYEALAIADVCNKEQFKADLKAHQQGKTDYLAFIGMSARMGIEKWVICMEKMTCTYYDKAGNEILVEHIPQ